MATVKPLRVAILWHMHQPNYQEPGAKRLLLPWVRLHALKDYLDMPLRAAAHDGIRVTFNLVPSLLDQLQLYLDGGTDRHLDLTRADPELLSPFDKREMLDTFFSAHPPTMIDPYPRYRELHRKAGQSDGKADHLPALFSSTELRDLQVWSNLTWVDPLFREEEPIRSLFAKERHFTEEEKRRFLEWQLELIGRTTPTYRSLYEAGRIDLSFTPYYHPILPLVCDTDAAVEAMPDIALPARPFRYPDDARWQVRSAAEKFAEFVGAPLTGMWPSEGSVSEATLEILRDEKIRWAATDEEILHHSLIKSGMSPHDHPIHHVYEHNGIRLFFRDHGLSDRIGFVYSGWPAGRAAHDFIGHLKRIRSHYLSRLDEVVVPVILDGENAWEYFPNDGAEFLDELYSRLSEDPELTTMTMTEAAESLPATPLPRLFAGSWINHNFRIWIGHHEDNAAWDLLHNARDALVAFQAARPDADADRLAAAWRQIYIAEGSDWNWWYGDDHQSGIDDQFDAIFRQHLMAVYTLIEQPIPAELHKPIASGVVASFVTPPEAALTPTVDGYLTHFYEWTGAGVFDCKRAGGAMHRVDSLIDTIHFAYDRETLYLRIDFADRDALARQTPLTLDVTLGQLGSTLVELPGDEILPQSTLSGVTIALRDFLELEIPRSRVVADGVGEAALQLKLLRGDDELERWPENESLLLALPAAKDELFWPV